MLCGGLTVFSPLVRNGVKAGSRVGVVGLGGLGHYAVLFAVALGAEVTVFSRTDAKKADALAMGATRFVATATPGFEKELFRELDLIVCTASSAALPISELLTTLDVGKKLVFVGLPEEGLANITSQSLMVGGTNLGSSHIGCRTEALQMLQIAADKKVKPWINVIPMKDAAKAIEAVEKSTVRYRTILVQDIQPVN
jgi:alcohol dehydrogenase (NADP+)